MLESYHWPGNVRELENLVQRACVLASGNVILAGDLPFDQASRVESERAVLDRAAKRFLRAAEHRKVSPVSLALRALSETALRETGSEEKAASLLGITPAELLSHLETADAAPAKKAAKAPARSGA
jgi:DNA-binding NtrC family response regulator